MKSFSESYKAAGVDITAGYKAVELMKSHIAKTMPSGVVSDIGGFGGLFELDVKGMEYISSAGLRVLLSAQKKMQKVGSMKVVNVCETVMEVFEMTGFADILVIE